MSLTDPPLKLFQKGGPGGPGPTKGGHKHARKQLADAVFRDALAVWDEHRDAFLRRLAFHAPEEFARFISKIMPQRLEVEHTTPFDDVDEGLLMVSLRISRAIAYLPPEDRELMEMLCDKADFLASSEKAKRIEMQSTGAGGQTGSASAGEEVPPFTQSGLAPEAPNRSVSPEPVLITGLPERVQNFSGDRTRAVDTPFTEQTR